VDSSYEHLLDCLARHIISLPKHKIKSLSEKMAKKHPSEFMSDMRKRIDRIKNGIISKKD